MLFEDVGGFAIERIAQLSDFDAEKVRRHDVVGNQKLGESRPVRAPIATPQHVQLVGTAISQLMR